MAEAFLGLKVSVLLHSGIKLEGEVSQIEPLNQQMTLKDVTLFFFGQPPHCTPVYGVVGKDIKDLQVITSYSHTTNTNTTPQPRHVTTLDNHLLEQTPPPPMAQQTQQQLQQPQQPQKSVSKNRKSKQQIPLQQSSGSNRNSYNEKRNGNGWAGEDVNIFIKEEFDFQKNLNMFDKAKIFAEIRESDETAPEELLVTLNRLPQKKVNLLPTENVLDIEKTVYNENDDDDFGDESDNDSQTPDEYSRSRRKSKITSVKKKNTRIMTVLGNILCPSVSPLQMAHVEHECTKVTNLYEELSIENGGRGTSLLTLKLLSQMDDIISPSIVILVGNNKNGALGLVAARHLLNHGCLVTVFITANEENLCNAIIKYQSIARKCGVKIYYDINQLDNKYDIIIDSILGSDEKLIDIQDASTYNIICNTIHWANSTKNPILSIDFPSGIDASTGVPHHNEYVMHPKWTICLGAPKTGCKSSDITGELYLVDIGIPRLCWKRVGIKGNTIPWGADFLVALEYDD